MSTYQSTVVRLPARLLRAARTLLDESGQYEDLSELLVVALENQLALESDSGKSGLEGGLFGDFAQGPHERDTTEALLALTTEMPGDLAEPAPTHQPLFVLTNRLSPIPFVARILVNLTLNGGPPDWRTFGEASADLARRVGSRVATEDAESGVPRSLSRAVGWPVGENAEKAKRRFRRSFVTGEGNSSAPLQELGIAVLGRDSRVRLTRDGVTLALAPNPLIGEEHEGEGTMSPEQRTQLRHLLRSGSKGELEEVQTFVEAVADGRSQESVDAVIRSRHPAWTENHIQAHRAALVGRLRELDVVLVDGRGGDAWMSPGPAANEFKAIKGAS